MFPFNRNKKILLDQVKLEKWENASMKIFLFINARKHPVREKN